MASLFDTLEIQAFRSGIEARTKESRLWFQRKVKEFITAVKIEQTYTKSEIMELYLNSVFFGHRAYGIQQASKFYFGKDIRDLKLNECATLVGILPAPNRYSPKKNIDTVIGYSNNFYQKYSDSYIDDLDEVLLTKIIG